MSHVVLLGDSIFDNARYVPGGPPVVERCAAGCPQGGREHWSRWTGTRSPISPTS